MKDSPAAGSTPTTSACPPGCIKVYNNSCLTPTQPPTCPAEDDKKKNYPYASCTRSSQYAPGFYCAYSTNYKRELPPCPPGSPIPPIGLLLT